MSKQNEPESKHTADPSLASASGSASFALHKRGPCMLCKGAEQDSAFDYCRACGYTVLPMASELSSKEETPAGIQHLRDAIERARGGKAPPIMQHGFA